MGVIWPYSGATMDAQRHEEPTRAGDGVLATRDREILAFERQWWKYAGAKEQAIKELFDMSATRYYQVLNALIDKPEALVADDPRSIIADTYAFGRVEESVPLKIWINYGYGQVRNSFARGGESGCEDNTPCQQGDTRPITIGARTFPCFTSQLNRRPISARSPYSSQQMRAGSPWNCTRSCACRIQRARASFRGNVSSTA